MDNQKRPARNEPCPCGSGKKFKRCHGAIVNSPPVPPFVPLPEQIRLELARHNAKEKQREDRQGWGRPIIATEVNGHMMVAVGNKVCYGKWKSVPDFLTAYLMGTLGPEWGKAEIAKPLEDRHPILVWYNYLCQLQQEHVKEPGQPFLMPQTGAAAAWFYLAYDLYCLEHNSELHAKLLGRLKNPDMFQGARYETFVAGTISRAGFTIEFEDEDDRRSTHVEFTATCIKSGRKYSIEAKHRNVREQGSTFRLGRLLQKALKKSAAHPRIIFLGLDFADVGPVEGTLPRLLKKALADLRQFEGRKDHQGNPLPPAYLIVTNRPYDHNLEGTDNYSMAMAEGFQIPDFKMDTGFPGVRAAYHACKAHEDMHQLLKSMKIHSQLPVTFDGSAPSLVFGDSEALPPLRIGGLYLALDANGVERPATMISGVVDPDRRCAMIFFRFDDGSGVMNQVPLSKAELEVYAAHPDTFFGVEQAVGREVKDQLDLFDFFMEGTASTSREKLLEFLAPHPDIATLKSRPQEELREIYAEGLVNATFYRKDQKEGTGSDV